MHCKAVQWNFSIWENYQRAFSPFCYLQMPCDAGTLQESSLAMGHPYFRTCPSQATVKRATKRATSIRVSNHLPLPWVSINTYFSLRAKVRPRRAACGQLPRNFNWSLRDIQLVLEYCYKRSWILVFCARRFLGIQESSLSCNRSSCYRL